MRQRLALVAVLAAGLAAGALLGTSGPALAFPHVCSGASCHGSSTDSFGQVCIVGATTYWEDSYLPSNAISPHLTSFSVTPKPPCTGATVSGPTVDSWPASKTDPDGKPAEPKAGESTFRIRWTVTVPAGSKPVGSMDVAWSIAWTEPASGGGRTETVTTTGAAARKYDLAVRISPPAVVEGSRAHQRIELEVRVVNNGPAPSPKASLHLEAWLFFAERNSSKAPYGVGLHISPARGCTGDFSATCSVRPLPPHGEESYAVAILWTAVARADYRTHSAQGEVVTVNPTARVRGGDCKLEETSCANNDTTEEIPVR